MPVDPFGRALIALHTAENREGLCAGLAAALAAVGLPEFTLIQRIGSGDEYVAIASSVVAPDDLASFVVMDGDPLLLLLDDSGEFIAGQIEQGHEANAMGSTLGVTAILELKTGSSESPTRAGYLLLHGHTPIAEQRRADLRTIALNFQAALTRQIQVEDYRNTCWNSTEALDAMNEMGSLMGTLDLRILLTKILQLTLQIGNAEVGSIVLNVNGRIKPQYEWGFTEEAMHSLKTPEGTGFVEAVIEGGEAVYVPSVYLDERIDTGEGMLPIESIVVLPLVTGNGTLGAINVVNVSGETGFNQDRLLTLRTICSLAAIAIENARYHEEALKNEQLKEQARIAENIQRGFFPRFVPDVAGYELAGRTVPAQFVGGDYYDWIQLPDGRLGVAVADVSGHGISAGLVMTLTRSFFRAAAQQYESPAELFLALNRYLTSEDLDGAYVTFIYGVLDPVTHELRLASAGHVPLVHYVAAEDRVDFVELPSIPLGMFEQVEYDERVVHVRPGDVLLFMTDGVVEAMSPLHQQFGDDRLASVLRQLREAEPGDALRKIHEAVQRHTHPGHPHDDVTTVLLRSLPKAA